MESKVLKISRQTFHTFVRNIVHSRSVPVPWKIATKEVWAKASLTKKRAALTSKLNAELRKSLVKHAAVLYLDEKRGL